MLQDFFVLKMFKLLSQLFGLVGKRFNEKAMVNFKFMTSQTAKQISTININS